MISYEKGDLLQQVKTGVILHQCNARGVMGAGFAYSLKHMYKRNYEYYNEYCSGVALDDRSSLLGHCIVTTFNNEDKLTIINAIGQLSTGGRKPTSYDALDEIFHDLYTRTYTDPNWNDYIHMPKIGSGLGGGKWSVIEQIILSHLPEDKHIIVWTL